MPEGYHSAHEPLRLLVPNEFSNEWIEYSPHCDSFHDLIQYIKDEKLPSRLRKRIVQVSTLDQMQRGVPWHLLTTVWEGTRLASRHGPEHRRLPPRMVLTQIT